MILYAYSYFIEFCPNKVNYILKKLDKGSAVFYLLVKIWKNEIEIGESIWKFVMPYTG